MHIERWSRPCLVLGSAPQPTLAYRSDMDLVCVNSSGYAARALDLPVPAVTVLGGYKLVVPRLEEDRQALRGLRTTTLLLITNFEPATLEEVLDALERLDYRYDRLMTVSVEERAEIVWTTTGERLAGEESPRLKVTNGLFAACYACFAAAPQVVLAGISFARDGHHYSDQLRRRQQIEPDRAAVRALRARGYPLFTSEAELAADTGLPLVGGDAGPAPSSADAGWR
jgi:hypothetical protein